MPHREAERAPLKKPSLEVIIKAVEALYSLREGEMSETGQGVRIAEARGMAAWAVRILGDATLTELGKRLGRDVSSLSSSVRRLLDRAKRDTLLAEKMKSIKEMVAEFASLQA